MRDVSAKSKMRARSARTTSAALEDGWNGRSARVHSGVLAVLLAVMTLTGRDASAELPSKESFHVYLLFGDSTMAGTAEIPDASAAVMDRCYLLNAEGKWEPARAPLNRYSTVSSGDAEQKLGPGYGFVEAMLAQDKDISIGLVVNAARGTKMEDWHMKSQYYRGVRGRSKIAHRSGTLKGLLWHHDGAGVSASRLDELKTLTAYLRMDLRFLDLPFIVGQTPKGNDINSILTAFTNSVHATAIASAEGLATTDGGQLDAAGMQVLGTRYAEQMLKVQSKLAAGQKSPARKMPLIDTHIHASIHAEKGLDVVVAWMKTNNIERAIVHTLRQSSGKADPKRETMLANFRKHRGKIYRFCYIEPDEVSSVEEAVAILEKEKADGAIGFGEHYGRGLMFDDPKNMRLYAACEKVGFPVMFHIDTNKNMDGKNFPHLRRALETYPKCIFIAHAQWWLQLPEGVCDRMLQAYPNLYAEPSGGRMAAMLNRDRAYTREFLIRNADKVLFGSDAGWWSIKNTQATELQFSIFDKLDLPEDVRTKIFRTNAAGLFSF